MSRIKPESLPKPKKVSKTQAKSLYNQFTATGNSKYDVYVEAAKELNPGEALSVMELPENVITSIQKKFRERGLTTAAGFYAVSKTLGSEEKGKKSLLIGRYATKGATARKSTARKSTRSASKKTATASKSPTTSRTARSKAATKSKAVKASRAKKATSRKSVAAKSVKKAASKATASKSRTRKPAAKKASTNGAATRTA